MFNKNDVVWDSVNEQLDTIVDIEDHYYGQKLYCLAGDDEMGRWESELTLLHSVEQKAG